MEEKVEVEVQEEVQEEIVEEIVEEAVEEPVQEAVEEPVEEEITVMIGDEPVEEEEKAPEWVRDLRKKNREDQRRIRELEAKLAEKETPPKVSLGKKPDLEEFDYDTEKYEQALASWFERKRAYDSEQESARKREEEANQSWQEKLATYAEAKTKLKVKDFDDAEAAVTESFNVTQQGVLIQGADNPALIVYALGKNPKKAKELAAITDPVKFAFAIAKLETQLKVNRKSPPPPEKTVGGTAPIRGTVDSNLDRLRAEAEKTGDYSKVFAYKRQKRA